MPRRVSKRRELSTAIGLSLSGRVLKRHFDHAIRGPDVITMPGHLRRHLGEALTIVWDRLNAHRSKEVKAYLMRHRRIVVAWLPPYAPQLNPEEGCHGHVKQALRNAAPETAGELRKQVDRGFARVRRRPDVLLGCFHHAGYRVKRLT